MRMKMAFEADKQLKIFLIGTKKSLDDWNMKFSRHICIEWAVDYGPC
jgi:hypothetical protein